MDPTLTLLPDGNVAIPSPNGKSLSVFTPSGEPVKGIRDEEPGRFGNLYRIDVDNQGNVYALDQSFPITMTGFSSDGALLTSFEVDQIDIMSRDINPFINKLEFSIRGNDELYIADRHYGSNINRYSTDGDQIFGFGGVSFEESEVLFPAAVTIAPDGTLYLLDDSSVVKHFTPDGHFIESFGDVGSERKDIVYAAGAVWTLTDGVVTRFDPETGEGTVIGRSASSEAGGQIPATGFAMDVDADGNIYIIGVAPSTGAEELFDLYYVQLDPTGEVIASQNLGPTFDRYIDVAIGPDGTFYLADSQSKQIFVYEPAS